MGTRQKTWASAADALREAVVSSGLSFKGLERETGVLRQSLMTFVRGQSNLRLDQADKLLAYFELIVTTKPDRKRTRKDRL